MIDLFKGFVGEDSLIDELNQVRADDARNGVLGSLSCRKIEVKSYKSPRSVYCPNQIPKIV